MTRRRLAAVAFLLVAAAACGDDGGSSGDESAGGEGPATTTTEATATSGATDDGGTSPLGRVATETVGPEAFADLPVPPGNISGATNQPAFAAWDGGAVFLGPAGGLVRFVADGGVDVTPTDGIDTGEEGVSERVVDVLASDDETLLAIGHQQELVADVIPTEFPVAWRSDDGESWEQLNLEGLSSGTDEVTVTTLVADPDGGWLAGGEIDDGNQTTLTLWSSEDGETWEAVDAEGLDHTDTEEEGERLVDLAVLGDTILATREATGVDDIRLSLLRSTGGPWEELDAGGLEPLELPNEDVLPTVTAVGDQFVVFGSTPIDDEFGERTPALFLSDDGESWTVAELDGPTLLDPFSLQALVATDRGAIGLTEGEDALTVWRFTDG